MSKRITISLDEEIESKIREIQAKKIVESRRSISFSHVLNQILLQGLKNGDN